MSRNPLLVIGLIVLLAFVFFSIQKPRSDTPNFGPAPELSISSLDGKKVSLSDLKGKVVLVDFWGTWCGPCRTSIPAIEQMYQKFKSRGFEVMGVALEQDGGKQVPAFVKEMKMTYLVGFPDSREQVSAYDPSSVPLMVLVDKEGDVRLRVAGYGPGMEEEISNRVESLL